MKRPKHTFPIAPAGRLFDTNLALTRLSSRQSDDLSKPRSASDFQVAVSKKSWLAAALMISGITALTPIDENTTELNHTTYWTIPYLEWLTPIVNYFVKTFLSQDLTIAQKQQTRLKFNPQLSVTVGDSGMPGRWYFFLKREWNESRANKRAFVNPIKETILRWRT